MLILPNAARYKPFDRYPNREFIKIVGPHVVSFTKGEILRLQRMRRLNHFYERAKEYQLTVVAMWENIRVKEWEELLKVVDFDTSEVGVLRLQDFRREFSFEKGEDERLIVT